jgi:hypothetical protein
MTDSLTDHQVVRYRRNYKPIEISVLLPMPPMILNDVMISLEFLLPPPVGVLCLI